MNNTAFFVPIIILLGISLAISFVISLFKIRLLPSFVLEILVGIALGPVVMKYFEANGYLPMTDFLYVIGFSFIMFLSGYDIHLEVFSKKVITCSYLDIGKLSIRLLLAIYGVSLALAFFFLGELHDKLAGIILLTITFSSTFAGVVVPLLHVEHLHSSNWGKVIITFSFLNELVSVLLLTLYMFIFKKTFTNIWSFALIALVFVATYFLLKIRRGARVEQGMMFYSTKLIVVALGAAVVLSEVAGGEYIFGAFLLGFLCRVIHVNHARMHFIETIGFGLFIPMFFVLVGMQLEIKLFVESPKYLLTVLLLVIAFLIAKLPMLALGKWYHRKTVVTSLFLSASTLVVAVAASHLGHELHLFSHEFGQSLILASIVTMVIGPLVFEAACFGPLRHIRTEEKEIGYGKISE